MRRTIKLLLVLGLAAAPPASAQAQDPANDPAAGSPSGTIYEIPLDEGRRNAAPRRGGSGSGRRSPIRSENNFGSSSIVPGTSGSGSRGAGGASPGGGGEGAASSAGEAALGARGGAGPDVGGGTDGADQEGAGGEAAGDQQGTGGDAGAAAGGLATQTGSPSSLGASGPSVPRGLLILGLGALVAAGLGAAAARQAGRRG